MIKLIVFDLDGVLVDAKDIHFKAFNLAVSLFGSKYQITKEEHLSKFDGLPTKEKLELLSKERGLPKEHHQLLWERKQNITSSLIEDISKDEEMISTIELLKRDGYKLHVASNSVRSTVVDILKKLGIIEYFDKIFSNNDVRKPKPNPEIYLRCMVEEGVKPHETLILEDSCVGRRAAKDSGAFLFPVKNTSDVVYKDIAEVINEKNSIRRSYKWDGGKMNVLIPMAGSGSRFKKHGYSLPKPLIDVSGKPMIQRVVENLNIDARFIFVVQREHVEQHKIDIFLKSLVKDCKIIEVSSVTDGAARTTLLAEEFINNNEPLLMANSDQYVEWDSSKFMYAMNDNGVDAGILTFNAKDPKWSYAKVDENGYVSEVAEKEPISDLATVGIYYWAKGSDYVKYAHQMINENCRVNNEFYVCPVFNFAIKDNKRVRTFTIPSSKMWGLGTPEDLLYFIVNNKEG